jgi:acyl phosphate:glycerol-3-phosphate acyltransferase
MTIELLIAIVVAGYLLGSIPAGYLMGRAKGIDIREHGSKNIGATNVFRVLGKGPGITVFVFDALKGLCAVRFGMWLSYHMGWHSDVTIVGQDTFYTVHYFPAGIAGILGAVAAILGHNFPVWLKFKGGKGVATSLGVVIGLVPLSAAVAFAVWAAVFFVSRYVSLASIIGAVTVPVMVAITDHGPDRTALLVFTILASLLIVLRHRANIQRLLNGTENRFTKKPK